MTDLPWQVKVKVSFLVLCARYLDLPTMLGETEGQFLTWANPSAYARAKIPCRRRIHGVGWPSTSPDETARRHSLNRVPLFPEAESEQAELTIIINLLPSVLDIYLNPPLSQVVTQGLFLT